MVDWDKNFAVIAQTSNTLLLIGRGNPGDDIVEFYDRAFGHAVMVLKIDGELHYKGYRFSIEGEEKLRKLRAEIYANAQDRYLEDEEIQKKKKCMENILRKGVRGEILDEGNRYRPRHEQELAGTIKTDLAYHDLNYDEKEVHSIWTQVKQDEQKEEKYYTLEPDRVRKSGKFTPDSLVHNCVTWIIETQHVSVDRFLLKRVPTGNISQFARNLRTMGEARETSEPD